MSICLSLDVCWLCLSIIFELQHLPSEHRNKKRVAALPPFPFAKGNMWTYGKEDCAQGQWGKGSIISSWKQLLLVLEGRDDKYLSGTGGLLQSGQYRLWLVEEVALYCNFCTQNVTNCILQPGDDIVFMAQELEKVFMQKIAQMPPEERLLIPNKGKRKGKSSEGKGYILNC